MKNGKDLFQIWMKEESDLIQSVAKSYGESICLEQLVTNIYALKLQKTREILTKMAILFALNSIKRDLAWFMSEGIFAPNSYTKFQAQYDAAVSAVSPLSMDAVAAFDVREEMLNAPIAADWVKYNTYDNQGNKTLMHIHNNTFLFSLGELLRELGKARL